MTRALASVFVPIGITGAVIALACALLAAFALTRGSTGLAGGAIGVWIVGAMLSAAASFANVWMPTIVATIALGMALVIGGLLRLAIRSMRLSREHAAQRIASAEIVPEAAGAAPHAPAARPARAVTSARHAAAVTDTVRVAA